MRGRGRDGRIVLSLSAFVQIESVELAVFLSVEDVLALLVRSRRLTAVDALTAYVDPIAYFSKPLIDFVVEFSIGPRTGSEQQVAAAGDYGHEHPYHLRSRLVAGVLADVPAAAERHTCFPRIVKNGRRNLQFRRIVVFVFAVGAASDHNKSRLVCSGGSCKPFPRVSDSVGFTNFTEVQPHKFKIAVAGSQLVNLSVNKVHKAVVPFRELDRIVVNVTVIRREMSPPVIVAVPVCYGEICTCLQTFVPECFKHLRGYVGARILVERTIG